MKMKGGRFNPFFILQSIKVRPRREGAVEGDRVWRTGRERPVSRPLLSAAGGALVFAVCGGPQ